MALPLVNETLKFSMTIPSTGQRVQYRPYLVKEEKILLQAFESKDTKMCLSAMIDTIKSCCIEAEDIDIARLATFDIEYMFTQLRAKSVGETSTIIIRCKECDESNEYVIDLDSLQVEMPNGKPIVEVSKGISVEMSYPTYASIMTGDLLEAERDMSSAIKVIANSIKSVLTEKERIDARDCTEKELVEFVESMTASQLKGLTEFLENMPALKQQAEFKCKKCGEHNELELKGLSDFF